MMHFGNGDKPNEQTEKILTSLASAIATKVVSFLTDVPTGDTEATDED